MIDKRTLVEYNDLLMFLSDSGVVMFDGSNVRNVSDGIVGNQINSWATKSTATAVLWDNKYLIAYTPGGGSVNSEALFYDMGLNVWGKVEGAYIGEFVAWNGGTDDGRIYFASSNQGSFYRWDIGTHDDGYAIATRYVTPSLAFKSGINDKSIKKFYIQQVQLGDWDMTVSQLANVTESETTGAAINLSPGNSALWDVAQWDVDSWSSEGSILTTRVAEFQGIAKYFKYRIDQEGYAEGIEVLGILATSRVRRLA